MDCGEWGAQRAPGVEPQSRGVITLEGWVDVMYYVGSFFMINLCLVVIATQFSETKQRENQLMQEQRARYLSNDSTLASFSEPGSCYEELLKYISHLYRKVKRRASRLYGSWQNKRRKKVNPNGNGGGGGGGGSGGSFSGRGRRWSARRRNRSIHHLIHHHHHHHHHYHISNGSPCSGPGASELCDSLEMKNMRPGGQLVVTSPLSSPSRGGAKSVHSVYHADCHFQGPSQVFSKASGVSGSLRLLGGLNGGMNYPTIMPSVFCSHSSTAGRGKGKRSTPHALNLNRGSASLGVPDPYSKLHQFVGEHGAVTSRLTCELMSCPYCARILENPDLELSDSDSAGSEADGVYEFTRDVRRGSEGTPGRSRHRRRRPKERNRVVQCWDSFRDKLKRIVDSKYFNRGIMIAILINTLSMGIEYHEQPEELTDVLEISNIVFTSMFALEMLLKVLAYGLFGYIKNPYNIFDGIIVVISVWEIIGQSDGGLSVLRTFRLLRVLKLVRFLPALRRQLVVLMKTMDNVATFCMLLMLFIFIFSILGMHLFGCKFSLKMENGDTIPDRKNFDSLLWAIVTVFQILTQEDWNVVLYNGMASTSPLAALYFVALMTFGNYVLFNLLVAILVEGFQAEGDANRSDSDEEKMSANFEEEEKMREPHTSEMKMHSLMVTPNGHMDPRASMPPPIIMRTAATPMPTPKTSPYIDSVHAYSESRRGSSASIDPNTCDQKSLSSLRSSPCPPWGSGSNWGSRRSSWNSLGRASSLKRKNQSGERESLLSGEGRGSSEDDDSDGGKSSKTGSVSGASLQNRAESLDAPELLQVPMLRPPGEHHDCNGKSLHLAPDYLHKDDTDLDEEIEESYCFRFKKMLEPYKPQWCRDHEDWSLYLFSPQNEFRMTCQKVIAHKMFDHVVLVFIFLNCITIALERPDILPHSTERVFLSVSNYIFTVIFVAEMTVKVVALGFYYGPNSYLQSSWNVLDGMLVFVSILDIIVLLASAGGNRILGILRVLRLLRTLRPLRVISRAPGLKLVVETLITSLRPIGNIVLICCAFFIVFGILGVQLFKGKFYHCEGFDTRNITNKSDCLQANYRWIRRKYNFDNLGQALMSLFVLSSKDGWVNIMYDGLDAVAVDQQPIRNHNPWMLLYFISFLLIVSFFVLNMFVGVVVENFHKCRQHQEAEEARIREEKRLRRLEKKRRSKEINGSESDRASERTSKRETESQKKKREREIPCTMQRESSQMTDAVWLHYSIACSCMPSPPQRCMSACHLTPCLLTVLLTTPPPANPNSTPPPANPNSTPPPATPAHPSKPQFNPNPCKPQLNPNKPQFNPTPANPKSTPTLQTHSTPHPCKPHQPQFNPNPCKPQLTPTNLNLNPTPANPKSTPNPCKPQLHPPPLQTPTQPPTPANPNYLTLPKAQQRPYYADYSPTRLYIHTLCTNHYLDLFITCIIGINVVTMSIEHYNQPKYLDEVLKYCNYFFTIVFVFEALLKLIAFGFRRFFKERWNQLDLAIVLLSIMGITLEEIEINASLPINPTIIRIMRVLRIARVLKLLKMATGMRALLDTVVQALPQVGNLGLLFMLLFFIYAALGVELFGKLECNDDNPCEGLSRHATFENFGMAFLTLFRVSTGDNWNGIMKDTLRECRPEDKHCLSYLPLISPIYFVTFVLIAQFVLVNVVVAVLMKHLEESNKEAKEDAEMDAEIELEMTRRLSTTSGGMTLGPESRATYMGPRPDSPGQGETLLPAQENLLSVRKTSVSRMHSLPNDSYMFRPVRPACSPHPLQEVDSFEGNLHLGSVTSVSSQPCEGSSLLRVPGASHRASAASVYDNSSLPKISPPRLSPTHSISKPLRRQEAIKNDSIDVQSCDSKDNLERQSSDSLHLKVPMPGTLTLPVPRISAPSSPQASPLLVPRSRTSSVHTHRQVYSQHTIPSRPSSQASSNSNSASPGNSMFESVDPADEEVRHINCSAKEWAEGQAEARSLSLSPYTSLSQLSNNALKNCSSATNLPGCGVKEKDLKKFYSVDAEGFLAKPSWADDPRRHSIEICPSIDDDSVFEQPADEHRRASLHGPPVSPGHLTIHRKKKMSPPCISIDPPLEAELPVSTASLTKISESSMLLRRRTPSCDSALQRDSLDLLEPTPLSQPPPPVPPQSPLLAEPPPKPERRPGTCRNEHLSIPQFSFDQSDLSSLSSMSDILSDSDQSTHSSSFDTKPEGVAKAELSKLDHLQVHPNEDLGGGSSPALLSVSRSPLRKRGLIRMASTREEDADDSVA
ncbi:hypothetical protein JZ751_026140 [Albula glossodonta]|uniref:Ion transport domain-containing protein n=1 Tax=Albula glossodonta TaxID=121402 RepID=A0A8T2PL52_9TELE|nr:hypothetical protein JZ751_026140 [Albula glossodonta]